MISLLFTAVLASERSPTQPMGGPGLVIQVTSATDFCMFLPPNQNETIALSEGYPNADATAAKDWAVAHCTQASTAPAGARLFYDGFITSVQFSKTADYVAIKGTINPKAANLPMDGGGFYDLDNNVNSPPGGMCQGYQSYYNGIVPVDGKFCVKCCTTLTGCRIDLLVDGGCDVAIPGTLTPDNVVMPTTGRTLTSTSGTASSATPSSNTGTTPNASANPKSNSGAGLTFTSICYAIAAAVAASFI